MASTAQQFANRGNSKRSTGPRTPEGKAASSNNAKTHGLSAADPVLPHEDRDQFNELLQSFRSTLAPKNVHEEFLVSQIAAACWKLQRADRIEVAMYTARDSAGVTSDALIAQAFIDKDIAAGFERLNRYRAGLERNYHRCVRELRTARKLRNEPNSQEVAQDQYETLLKEMLAHPALRDDMELDDDPAASNDQTMTAGDGS